jgi:hypothetical protein
LNKLKSPLDWESLYPEGLQISPPTVLQKIPYLILKEDKERIILWEPNDIYLFLFG